MVEPGRELLPGMLSSRPAPPDADISRPSAARVYDYYLGGMHNFAPDRQLAERVLAAAPWVKDVTHANRRFLTRAVRHLVTEVGVRQFLDLGSGIPTVAHSRELLAAESRVVVLQEDLRDTEQVIAGAANLLDLTVPVAVLMVSVMLFISDDDRPDRVISRYMDPLAAGSFLAVSHPTNEHADGPLIDQIRAVVAAYEAAGTPLVPRSSAQLRAWFTGLELLEPGVVALDDWRPTDEVRAPTGIAELSYGGVARKVTARGDTSVPPPGNARTRTP